MANCFWRLSGEGAGNDDVGGDRARPRRSWPAGPRRGFAAGAPANAPLPEASSPAPTPKAALAEAPGPGPPAQAAEAEASSPEPAAQSDGPLVASADGGVQSFAHWMSSLPPAELMRLTESLEAFAEAEALWMTQWGGPAASCQGPRRAHRHSKVSFKLATGFAYLEWRAGAGSKTRSPLKDP